MNNSAIQKPMYALVVSWALLLPLLFFVARGTFSFDRASSGNFTQSEEDALNSTGAGSAYFQAEQGLVYLIVLAAAFPWMYSLGGIIRENALVFSLPALSLLSVLWTQSIAKTLPFGVFAVVLTLFGVYLYQRFSPERQVELFVFVGWIAIILSLIVAVFFPAIGRALSYGTGAWRGIWIQKNHMGQVMTLLIYGALCLSPRTELQKASRAMFIFFGCVLVGMSQSRTGWILLALSFAFMAFLKLYQKFKTADRLMIVIALSVFIVVLCSLAYTYSADIAIALGKDPTLTGRTDIFRVIIPELGKRPLLGWGYRGFWLGMKGESGILAIAVGTKAGLINSENAILEIWLELGLVGVMLGLITIAQACRNAVTCLSENSPKYIHWYVLIVFFTVLSIVDGEKIMFPHTVEWLLFVLAYIGLSAEAKRIRSLRVE